MPTAVEVQTKVDKLPTNLDRLDSIVNGPASGTGSEVTVDSGTVKTIARIVAEHQAQTDASAANAAAAAASATAADTSADAALAAAGDAAATVDGATMSSHAAYLERQRTRDASKPKAVIYVAAGQSNNTQRSTALKNGTYPGAYMPVGGNCITYFDYTAVNATHAMHYNDVASAVPHAEGVGGSPLPGMASTLLGGRWARAYLCSVAIGARPIEILSTSGPLANAEGVISQLCRHARDAGYDPEVVINLHHSEAQMAQGDTEDQAFDKERRYIQLLRRMAAASMRRPHYVAPVQVFLPIVTSGAWGALTEAHPTMRAMARLKSLPGVYVRPSYPYDSEADRTHQSPGGMIDRGEDGGTDARRIGDGIQHLGSPEIIDIQYDATGPYVDLICSEDMGYTTSSTYNFGSMLNTAYQLGGVEVFDAGGRYATVVITWASAGTAGNTVTIGTTVLTAVASGATGYQYNIGATAGDTAANFASVVNANTGALGVTAGAVGGAVTLTANAAGYAGNSILISESGSATTITGSWPNLMFGGAIQVTAVAAQGRRIRCTLASAPVGATTALRIRVALQASTSTLTPGKEYRAGSQFYALAGSRAGVRDPTATFYRFLMPHEGYARTAG